MAQRNRRNRLRFDPDPSDDDDQDDDDQDDDDQDDDEVDYSALELSVLLRRRGRRPSTQGLELCFHRPWASTAGTLRLHFGADPDQPASIEFDDPTGPPGHVPESYLRAHPPDAPGFIVRYDAVRLFPVDDDDDDDEGRDVLRLGHGHNHNHNHDASSPQPQPLEFIRRLAIVVGGLYILLCIVFSAKARLMRPTPLLSTTECVVDTTELPLFSQTDNIFLSYASVPRVVIFGESGATCGPDDDTATTPDSTGTTRTQCRPRDGPVYPQHDDAVDVAALPLPTTAYRLCETSSDGRFVPETVFLEDLANIVLQVGNDLRRLADAGPMDFRFTRLATVAPGTTVSSTQFRWSTEPGGGGFIGSHAALPAVARPRGSNDKTARGYANPWMPASTAPDGSTQPTARPPSPLGIRSQDPPLDELCDAVVRQVRALGRQHVQATQSLLATVATQAQVAYLSHVDALDDLVDYALDDDPADNRTNSDRARLLHNRREELRTGDGATVRDVTTTVHPLDSPETPPASAHRPPPLSTRGHRRRYNPDTARIPPSFLSSVSSHMSRIQQTLLSLESSSSLSASSRTAATHLLPPYSPFPLPPPRSFIAAQQHNKTLALLLAELDDLLSLYCWEASSPGITSLIADLTLSASSLDTTTTHLQALLDRVDQVTSRVPNPAAEGRLAVNASYTPGTSGAVARLYDAAPFLRDVALPRLALLRGRAARGLALLHSVRSRVREMRAEVAALAAEDRSLFAVPHPGLPPGGGGGDGAGRWANCTAAYTYRYLPGDLDALLGQARRTLYWLRAEYGEVAGLMGRIELDEGMLRKDVATRGRGEALVVSRWSALDDRADPRGEERLVLRRLWRERGFDSDEGEGARPGWRGWQLLSWWRPSPLQVGGDLALRRHGAEGWPVPRG